MNKNVLPLVIFTFCMVGVKASTKCQVKPGPWSMQFYTGIGKYSAWVNGQKNPYTEKLPWQIGFAGCQESRKNPTLFYQFNVEMAKYAGAFKNAANEESNNRANMFNTSIALGFKPFAGKGRLHTSIFTGIGLAQVKTNSQRTTAEGPVSETYQGKMLFIPATITLEYTISPYVDLCFFAGAKFFRNNFEMQNVSAQTLNTGFAFRIKFLSFPSCPKKI